MLPANADNMPVCLAQKIRFSPIDHWRIAFLRSGRTWTEVDGHVAQNEPGMMEVRSLGRPFRRRHLLTAHAMLADPAGSQKIADIGLAIGIKSSANFSRTFTPYFGYSPSSVYRKNSIVDQIPPAERGVIKDYHQYTFEGLLRPLGLF
jgi:AraC-like DNA-binding protein